MHPGPGGEFTDGQRVGTLFAEDLERRVEDGLPDAGGTASGTPAYFGVAHTPCSLTQDDLL